MHSISKTLLGLCTLALLTACNASDHLSISGSTTVLPAVSKTAESFHEGQTDIGMMSRDITAEEKAQFPNITFTPIAIGRDAVAPVISSEIYEAGVESLTLTEIAAIYRGEIDNWSYVGGPDKAIQTAITQSDSAIGMLSHAWFNDDVKGISIERADGTFIAPTLDEIRSGSFPITRDLNIVVRNDISPKAQEFID